MGHIMLQWALLFTVLLLPSFGRMTVSEKDVTLDGTLNSTEESLKMYKNSSSGEVNDEFYGGNTDDQYDQGDGPIEALLTAMKVLDLHVGNRLCSLQRGYGKLLRANGRIEDYLKKGRGALRRCISGNAGQEKGHRR
ncbi:unnamed protein product, partial [Owenia fusiformis]